MEFVKKKVDRVLSVPSNTNRGSSPKGSPKSPTSPSASTSKPRAARVIPANTSRSLSPKRSTSPKQRVGRVISTARSGAGKLVGRTASTALDLVGGSSHGSNRSVGSHSSRGKRKTTRKKGANGSDEEPEEALIYCSDMYSVDFVLEDLKKYENSPSVVKVEFEDLIARDEGVTIQAVKAFLVDTTDPAAQANSMARIKDEKAAPKSSKKGKGPQKRVWQSIAFIDCISDAEDYMAYLEKKKKFLAGLNRLLSMKKMKLTLPIVFKAKIEIHSMLGVFDIIQLLQQIERDEGISKAKFPSFSGKQSQIADEFVRSVDAESLEWTGQPVEIILRYAKEDMNVRASENSVGGLDISSRKNPSTAVIGECVKALERLLDSSTDLSSLRASESSMIKT